MTTVAEKKEVVDEPEVLTRVEDRDLELMIFTALMTGDKESSKKLDQLKQRASIARMNGLVVTIYQNQDGELHWSAKAKKSLGFAR